MTATQAAAALGISNGRLSQLIAEGEITVERFGKNDRYIRIHQSEVERVKAKRQEERTGTAEDAEEVASA